MERVRKSLNKDEQAKDRETENVVDMTIEKAPIKNLQASQVVWHKDTNLGIEDFEHVHQLATLEERKKRGAYRKYSDKDRFKIGKYTSENGPIAAVRKFRGVYLSLNENTARSMREKYKDELQTSLRDKRDQQHRNCLYGVVGLWCSVLLISWSKTILR